MTEIFNQLQQKERRRMLRNNSTRAEQRLWLFLKSKQVKGFKFRRQFGVGPFIVDFYCPEAKLVIEVDGDSHGTDEAKTNDEMRQNDITALGLRVIRFTDEDVLNNIESVISVIESTLPLTKGEVEGVGLGGDLPLPLLRKEGN